MKIGNETDVSDQQQIKTSRQEYTQFSTRYDSETSTIWCWMNPEPRPCMNGRLIDELVQLQQQLTDTYTHQHPDTIWPFRHLILASKIPGIYNLGGDLELIKEYIVNNEEEKLRDYAYKATNLIHRNINNLDLPITMISLVQGQALGAGFEAALSCDVIIAERSSKLGFPEILFNMFPGMGAYNLLARRIGTALAERIILSGKTYSAEELFKMGVIDVIAEDGEGVQATEKYLNSHNQSHNTIRSMKKIRQIVHPITQQDLFDIVDIWMEASMNLSKKDLSKMERLLYLQTDTKNTKNIKENDSTELPRRGDWRKITDVSFPLVTHLGENVSRNRRKNEGRRRNKKMVTP
ncbi:MAG: crotonase/enoyl-CoA hydratase family protein [Proteobacteria bacterium]|nr:crotonase/enoyl-CoA hydratase family protein [Pseudomonadota bacterium]